MLQLLRQWKRRRLDARFAREDAIALIESYGGGALAEASRRAIATPQEPRDKVRRPGHWSRVCGELERQVAAND
jgi:hypothetical protein